MMRQVGIDLANRRPRLLTRDLAEATDVVVTMGCGDACPHFPGKREEIESRVRALADELPGE